ncbi:uncharacterized protein LOC119767221 [Culex quinquefasciatus]|uniref:uncharacterized protein LOC119766214 n=1 Tax=Culex quinquefasciatus TaxID=7176 RepID=UPI0018E31562|nr:uncharacterized protein LOC119766214 [Culex quinquefasciatus]XP_038111244.1 uncharacterized protein LOC119767221 [Culex quinquefasciatus]
MGRDTRNTPNGKRRRIWPEGSQESAETIKSHDRRRRRNKGPHRAAGQARAEHIHKSAIKRPSLEGTYCENFESALGSSKLVLRKVLELDSARQGWWGSAIQNIGARVITSARSCIAWHSGNDSDWNLNPAQPARAIKGCRLPRGTYGDRGNLVAGGERIRGRGSSRRAAHVEDAVAGERE